MKEFLEKTLRQNVIMTENKEVYKKLPLAYCIVAQLSRQKSKIFIMN